jgi:hypothetical protein
MKKLLLASVCALALGGMSNASAQPWAASVDGDYTHTQTNSGGVLCPSKFCNPNGYDFNGALDLPWDWWGIGLEVNGGAHGLGGSHDYQGGGSLVWNGIPNFRIAGTFVYNSANIFPFPSFKHVGEWQTGIGAEWYLTPWLTLSAQGGGIEGKFHGAYFGGTVKGYICPDLSLAGYIDYDGLSALGAFNEHETDYGVKAEWLFWQDVVPLALTVRYEHSQDHLNFFPNINPDSFFVGLKLYLDEGMGPKPLVERNRTGTLDTIGPIAPLGMRYTL